MKYSPIATPAYGAMYCSGAPVEALAETTIVYSNAPVSSNFCTTRATVDSF